MGGIWRERGPVEMFAAASRVKAQGFRLEIAGVSSPPALIHELLAHANPDRVRFHGWLDRTDTAALLEESSVGLVTLLPSPADVESLPIKLFEYMAAALPVVASDFPAWRAIVEEAQCGILVDPTSPSETAEAIDWLLDHPADARAMGGRGREAVLKRFNWEAESSRLLDLYDALLGAR